MPLQRLAGLDADQRAAVVQALLGAKGFTPIHELADKIADASAMKHDQALEIIYALLSFNVQLGAWDEPSSAVAAGVAESEDLELGDTDRSNLGAILNELLDAHSLSTAAKAADLISDHEHFYGGIRIITDLRPVFGDDPSAMPEGVTLAATIKIDHYTGGRLDSLYIAADDEDLRSIRDSVDRALKKSETMRELMKANNLPLYRTERDES
ncbi:MAG TPA: hypothetical protein VFR75_11355 [Solirubrobacterales bacterium]|nr:hypothetical protein [Solirubrobacterales bacterium]